MVKISPLHLPLILKVYFETVVTKKAKIGVDICLGCLLGQN